MSTHWLARLALKAGDASIGVTTHSDKKLPPAIGAVLCAAGVVFLVAGSRKGRIAGGRRHS